MQIAEDIKTKRLVRASFESCRTVAIFGKRGTGKSYTLGRMLEQAYFAQRHTIVVIDPLSVFWQTAIAESGRAIAVNVLTAGEPTTVYGPLHPQMQAHGVRFSQLQFNAHDLDADAWTQLFGLKLTEPLAILLFRAIVAVQEQIPHWQLDDLLPLIEADALAQDSTKRALENRVQLVKSWGVFTTQRSLAADMFLPNCINVVDVSMFAPGAQSLRNLIAKLVVDALFALRLQSRKCEVAGLDPTFPPVLLAIDEAHDFCPAATKAMARASIIRAAKEGRQPDISLILATQQPSALSFDYISQCDLNIIHYLTLADDIKTVARLASSYAANVPAYLKATKKTGRAIIIDDTNEQVVIGDILPRHGQHGGGVSSL